MPDFSGRQLTHETSMLASCFEQLGYLSSGNGYGSWQTLAPGAKTKLGFVVECAGTSAVPHLFVSQSVAVNKTACLISEDAR